jgi:hypothetical protein
MSRLPLAVVQSLALAGSALAAHPLDRKSISDLYIYATLSQMTSDAFMRLVIRNGYNQVEFDEWADAHHTTEQSAPATAPATHSWNGPDGSTCVKCGDKDWMPDAGCSESKLTD